MTCLLFVRVMVLDKGELMELDSPGKLLDQSSSMFFSLAKQSGIVWCQARPISGVYSVPSKMFFFQPNDDIFNFLKLFLWFRAGNSCIVDIKINVRSSLFVNMQMNKIFIWLPGKCLRIQLIRVSVHRNRTANQMTVHLANNQLEKSHWSELSKDIE